MAGGGFVAVCREVAEGVCVRECRVEFNSAWWVLLMHKEE